jgi:ABC-2 type transport system ATP-binding protein
MPNPSDVILEVDAAAKRFATVQAVAGVSMTVKRGEIFALLGPNGAGKSTLVRMIIGMTQPDTGTVVWRLGNTPSPRPAAHELGYLPEDRGLYRDQSVVRTLVYFGKLRGMSAAAAKSAGLDWLKRLQLSERTKEKLEALSKGNQQKVQFITSVMHKPAVAVLDEPFSGLDPLNQHLFCELLQSLRNDGMTIILSAHQMQLVERLADRLLLMSHGKRVLYGTLDEIRRETSSGKRLRLETTTPAEALATIEGVTEVIALPQRPGGEDANQRAMELLLAPETAIGAVVTRAAAMGEITSVHSQEMSLHDIYVKALGGNIALEPESQEATV